MLLEYVNKHQGREANAAVCLAGKGDSTFSGVILA